MFQDELGKRIKYFRQKSGLTQGDLANALQITSQAVSKWERGENTPDIINLTSISNILNISVDRLLGHNYNINKMVNGTILFSDIEGFSNKSKDLVPEEIALFVNGHFYKITECILKNNGIPIKYIGDSFLCVFLGEKNQERALKSALSAKSIISDTFSIGINTGPFYLGPIGHPEYSRPDIMGDYVQLSAGVNKWAGKCTNSKIAATEFTMKDIEFKYEFGKIETVDVKGKIGSVKLYEIVRMKDVPEAPNVV